MQRSRKKATAQNIIVSLFYQFVTIGLGFIIPRLFLTTYGPSIHGLTSTITNSMSYVMLLYAGLNTASVQALYKPIGKNDTKKINEVLNAIKMYYIHTGIGFTVLVLLLSLVLPFFVEEIPSKTVFLMMLVMGLQSSINSFLISTNVVLLQADQKLYISNMINIIMMFFRGVIQITLINLDSSPIIVQAVPSIMLIFSMIMQKQYIIKNYPFLDSNVKPDKKALSKRWSALIHQVSGLVVNNTDIFLLTLMTGNMTLVSVYSVYQLVFTQLYTMMTTVFSQGSVASFGNLIITGNNNSLKNIHSVYEFGYYAFISVVYSVTAVMMLPFVKLYTEGVVGVDYVDHKLVLLFVIIGIANNLRVPGGTLINAGGYYKETQWRAVLEATINLAVSLFLIKPLGMYGLLIGTVASFTYRTIDIIIFSNKYILKKSSKLTFFRAFRVTFIIIISVLFFYYLTDVEIINWLGWFFRAFTVGIFASLLTVIVNFIFELTLSKRIAYKLIKIITIK